MLTSQLIAMLQQAQAEHGDLPVVSGLSRSGYGEDVEDVVVLPARTFGDNTQEAYLELVLGDETICEATTTESGD